MPSIHVAIQRLRARPTCRLEPNAQLGWWSRVLNLSGDSSRIQIDERSVVKGELFTFRHGAEIRIGRWCYLGDGSRVWSACRIHIGDRVLISHQVNIFDNLTHPIDAGLRHEHFRHIVERGHPSRIDWGERPVTIEDDAWIGAGATILRGVRVGIGSIVGAGSVVTHDVPDWPVVAGNP